MCVAGSPRVGNRPFAQYLEKHVLDCWRVVVEADPVLQSSLFRNAGPNECFGNVVLNATLSAIMMNIVLSSYCFPYECPRFTCVLYHWSVSGGVNPVVLTAPLSLLLLTAHCGKDCMAQVTQVPFKAGCGQNVFKHVGGVCILTTAHVLLPCVCTVFVQLSRDGNVVMRPHFTEQKLLGRVMQVMPILSILLVQAV